MTARRLAPFLLMLLLGCAGGEPARVAVVGRVTYRGSPVRSGVIAFTPDKERGYTGNCCRANLYGDGTFRVPDGGLPIGWYRITVASLDVVLPSRYRDPDLANLAREVTPGTENSLEILLED